MVKVLVVHLGFMESNKHGFSKMVGLPLDEHEEECVALLLKLETKMEAAKKEKGKVVSMCRSANANVKGLGVCLGLDYKLAFCFLTFMYNFLKPYIFLHFQSTSIL